MEPHLHAEGGAEDGHKGVVDGQLPDVHRALGLAYYLVRPVVGDVVRRGGLHYLQRGGLGVDLDVLDRH